MTQLPPEKNLRSYPLRLMAGGFKANLVRNAQRSKAVKVLSRGYANESSCTSIKERYGTGKKK
jgi:hypothetical protein